MYGPHTRHVEALLEALTDPSVRRRLRRRSAWTDDSRVAYIVYERVCAAGRLEVWDAARMTAAKIAVPSQADDAAGAAVAIVASDLIDDATWRHFTRTPLAEWIGLQRPDGVLAERCPCGRQVGERLVAAKVAGGDAAPRLRMPPACLCVTPSLPTPASVRAALQLVRNWETLDWVDLVTFARRVAR